MSKKGKKGQRQEQDTLYRVHCECVRRNPEYKERYAKLGDHPWGAEVARDLLAREFGVRSGDGAPNPDERPPLAQALTRAIPEVWSRLTTSSMTDRWLEQAMSVVATALTDAKVDLGPIGGTLTLAYIPDEDAHRHRVTTLDMRWSKKDLMDTLEFWVGVFLGDRAAAGLKQRRSEQRFRVVEYSRYLEVYDLREQGGRTFGKIAHLLWPDNVGATEKRARDYYNKGKKLVLNPPLRPKGRRSSADRSPVQKPGPK